MAAFPYVPLDRRRDGAERRLRYPRAEPRAGRTGGDSVAHLVLMTVVGLISIILSLLIMRVAARQGTRRNQRT